MSIDEQLGRLRPSIEVEMLVRQLVASRSVEVVRHGEELIISRPGSDVPAMHCFPAVVSIALDPPRARSLEGTALVERIESKTASTSYVWLSTSRLRGVVDQAVTLAQEAVDRVVHAPVAATRARGGTTRTTTPRTPRTASPRKAPAAAVPPPPEPKICPRCGLQISAAGSCFCD